MFENIIQYVINNLFGDYVGQLDATKISFALLQGQLDLEKVPLRSLNLKRFGLPFGQIKQGLVGQFSFHLPFGSLFSQQQWTLELADVFVHICLDELEDVEELNVTYKNNGQPTFFEWTQIVKSISSKIQLVLKNVHVQFEVSPNLSVGLRLRHLFATLNDPNNEQGFLGKVQIHGFQLYMTDEIVSFDALKQMPWNLKNPLMNMDKLNINLLTNKLKDAEQISISIESKLTQTTMTTQNMAQILLLLNQSNISFDQIDFNRLLQLNLAIAYDFIVHLLFDLFELQINNIKIDTHLERTESKLLDDQSSMEFQFDILNFDYVFQICADQFDYSANVEHFELQITDKTMNVQEDLFYDVYENNDACDNEQSNQNAQVFVLKMAKSDNAAIKYETKFNRQHFTVIEITDLEFEFTENKFSANYKCSMNFFNDQKDTWEPFIEEVGFKFEFDWYKFEIGFFATKQPVNCILTQTNITQLLYFQQQLFKFDFNVFACLIGKLLSLVKLRYLIDISLFEFSLFDDKNKELLFGQVSSIQIDGKFLDNEMLQVSVQIEKIQIDNQLLDSKQWQFLYCSAHSLRSKTSGDEICIPTIQLEILYNFRSLERIHFDCFRLKFANTYLNADELLLFTLLKFFDDLQQSFNLIDLLDTAFSIYFDNLELSFDSIYVSIETVDKNRLPAGLQTFSDWIPLPLVSFQNAQFELSTFRRLKHEFNDLSLLFWTVVDFYFYQILKQFLNIASAMDAFGAVGTLTRTIEHSFGDLFFNRNFNGFLSNISYGLTNSMAKISASISHGAGQLTFDSNFQSRHFQARQDVLKVSTLIDTQSAFSLMYTGVKSLSIGLYGGLTAIAKNTVESTQTNGIQLSSILSGVSTGAVDTITKPTQGLFNLIETSALALQTLVSSNVQPILGFSAKRLRLPQLYQDQNNPLIKYDADFVRKQHEFAAIIGNETNEVLKHHLICYELTTSDGDESQIQQNAFMTQHFCYIVQQTDNQHNEIVQRINLDDLLECQVLAMLNSKKGAIAASFKDQQQANELILCSSLQVASQLCECLKQQISNV